MAGAGRPQRFRPWPSNCGRLVWTPILLDMPPTATAAARRIHARFPADPACSAAVLQTLHGAVAHLHQRRGPESCGGARVALAAPGTDLARVTTAPTAGLVRADLWPLRGRDDPHEGARIERIAGIGLDSFEPEWDQAAHEAADAARARPQRPRGAAGPVATSARHRPRRRTVGDRGPGGTSASCATPRVIERVTPTSPWAPEGRLLPRLRPLQRKDGAQAPKSEHTQPRSLTLETACKPSSAPAVRQLTLPLLSRSRAPSKAGDPSNPGGTRTPYVDGLQWSGLQPPNRKTRGQRPPAIPTRAPSCVILRHGQWRSGRWRAPTIARSSGSSQWRRNAIGRLSRPRPTPSATLPAPSPPTASRPEQRTLELNINHGQFASGSFTTAAGKPNAEQKLWPRRHQCRPACAADHRRPSRPTCLQAAPRRRPGAASWRRRRDP